jgi:hypothetical protein
VFEVCKKLRQCTPIGMWVTVSVSYPFQDLEEWAQSVSGYIQDMRRPCQYIMVILRLPQAGSNSSTEFFFPAVLFVRALKQILPWAEFKVVAADEDEANVRSSIDLATICQHLLIFVYDLLKSSSDPVNQPIPRIWIDKDLRVSHAEIEDDDGRSVYVHSNLGDYTLEELDDDAWNVRQFFLGYHGFYTGNEDAAAPELTGFTAGTMYPEDTLFKFAQELAGLCDYAY